MNSYYSSSLKDLVAVVEGLEMWSVPVTDFARSHLQRFRLSTACV
jgi:hypothetical protein